MLFNVAVILSVVAISSNRATVVNGVNIFLNFIRLLICVQAIITNFACQNQQCAGRACNNDKRVVIAVKCFIKNKLTKANVISEILILKT